MTPPQQTDPVPFQWTRVERLEYEHCPCLVAVPYYHGSRCVGYEFYSVDEDNFYEEAWGDGESVDDVKWIAPLIEPPKIDREDV